MFRYVVREQIGAGGMGVIFRAQQVGLARDVALKLLPAWGAGEPDAQHRFRLEMQSLARLDHPALVKVLDHGEHRGQPYFAMELVEGTDLWSLIQRAGRQSFSDVRGWLIDLADALVHIHAHGLIHRDVKPANVMLTREGRVKLVDFGLACNLERTAITAPGVVIGTIKYMAPEALTGAEAEPSRDVYALALAAHELLTGASWCPFEDVVRVTEQILNEEAPRLQLARPDLPQWFMALQAEALARDPAARVPASAYRDRLAQGDGRATRRRAAVPPPVSAVEPGAPGVRSAAGPGVALAVGACLAMLVATWRPAPAPAPGPAATVRPRAPVEAAFPPVHDVRVIPTDASVLVDLDVGGEGELTLVVEPDGAALGAPEVAPGRHVHHVFEGLRPDTVYALRASRPGATEASWRTRFRTATRPVDATAVLDAGAISDLFIESFDGSCVGPLARWIERTRPASVAAWKDIARMTLRVRDPGLARRCLERLRAPHDEELGDLLLRAVCDARLPESGDLAARRIAQNGDHEVVGACLRALEARHDARAVDALATGVRTSAAAFALGERMARCDPTRARARFAAWLADGRADPVGALIAAQGLRALGGDDDVRALAALARPWSGAPLQRIAAAELATLRGDSARAAFAGLLEAHPDDAQLIWLAGLYDHRSALPRLRALAAGTGDPATLQAARGALGLLGAGPAAPGAAALVAELERRCPPAPGAPAPAWRRRFAEWSREPAPRANRAVCLVFPQSLWTRTGLRLRAGDVLDITGQGWWAQDTDLAAAAFFPAEVPHALPGLEREVQLGCWIGPSYYALGEVPQRVQVDRDAELVVSPYSVVPGFDLARFRPRLTGMARVVVTRVD